jgi:hypothetical protein
VPLPVIISKVLDNKLPVAPRLLLNILPLPPITESRKDSTESAMDRQKIKEIISILMESALYFDFSLQERLEIVKGLALKANW